jgi:copper chaperone CopZ
MFKKEFRITNITCDACVKLGTTVLRELSGVSAVKVDKDTGKTTLEADREIPREEIIKALEEVDKTTDL